jgi:hypothetical protein
MLFNADKCKICTSVTIVAEERDLGVKRSEVEYAR